MKPFGVVLNTVRNIFILKINRIKKRGLSKKVDGAKYKVGETKSKQSGLEMRAKKIART